MLPVDQLNKPLTPQELEATLFRAFERVDLPVDTWRKGGIVLIIIKVYAHILSAFTYLVVWLFRSAFLDTAKGDYLTRLARDRYKVERIEESKASGALTIANPSTNVYWMQPGEMLFENSSTSARFVNTQVISIAALVGVDLPVDIEAVTPGEVGTSEIGAIDRCVNFPELVVSNSRRLVGSAEETDAALRERCIDSLGKYSPNGPEAAYRYQAKSTKRPDGTTIRVNRVWVSPHGIPVQVRVASPAGVVAGDKADPDTDLGMIQAAIDKLVVPRGIVAEVESAVEVPLAIVVDLWVREDSAVAPDAWEGMIQATIGNYLSTHPIAGHRLKKESQGYLWGNTMIGLVGRSHPDIVLANINIGDVALGNDEFAQVVTPTVNVNFAPSLAA